MYPGLKVVVDEISQNLSHLARLDGPQGADSIGPGGALLAATPAGVRSHVL